MECVLCVIRQQSEWECLFSSDLNNWSPANFLYLNGHLTISGNLLININNWRFPKISETQLFSHIKIKFVDEYENILEDKIIRVYSVYKIFDDLQININDGLREKDENLAIFF